MLLDNTTHTTLPPFSLPTKTPVVDISCLQCTCGDSSEPSSPHSDQCSLGCSSPAVSEPSSPTSQNLPQTMSFVPRPFPPLSLSDVPIEYIIDQLRSLAPRYFNKPETADCTLIVPVPHGNMQGLATESFAVSPGNLRTDPTNRRATAPCGPTTPQIRLHLHIDYLSAHSTFLRGLFSGTSPLDLINTTPTSAPAFAPPAGFTVPANRLPRLLPSSQDHPTLYLPVPDPSSFNLLIHWMYFGHTGLIEEALETGVIQWEGIARNVEYLGLSRGIKVFLGQWYQDYLSPQQPQQHPTAPAARANRDAPMLPSARERAPRAPASAFHIMSRPASPALEEDYGDSSEEEDDEDEFDDCMEWSDEEGQKMDLCVVVQQLDLMDEDDPRGRVRARPRSLQAT